MLPLYWTCNYYGRSKFKLRQGNGKKLYPKNSIFAKRIKDFISNGFLWVKITNVLAINIIWKLRINVFLFFFTRRISAYFSWNEGKNIIGTCHTKWSYFMDYLHHKQGQLRMCGFLQIVIFIHFHRDSTTLSYQ